MEFFHPGLFTNELSAEQAFWKNSVNSLEPTLSIRPTNVEVPKELPKVSMVNTSLKKLKHHLANFDVVVKERTTPTAITEGSWGFEHTKACFRDEIIPFVQALKDLFSTFNQHLVDELSKVQNVFYQMEQAVEQHRIESKTFECLKLETELQMNFVKRETYDKLFKSFTILEKHCISLEVDTQLKQEIFQRENSVSIQSVIVLIISELNELKAQSQEKDTVIKKLKERIKSLSGKIDKDKIKQDFEEIETINIELDHRCNGCMLSDNHDLCVLDFINNVNARAKSRSVKKNSKRKVWKPTGKAFTTIRYIWRPTGRTFTIVGNACPLTRITTTTKVPLRKSSALDNKTPKHVITLVYSRKPRKSKTSVPVNNYKVVQIVLWYLDSECSKHMTGDLSHLTNFVNKFLGTVKFGNDHVAMIMGYGDYQIGNVTISKASKTKSWLWHCRLSHLNFGEINHLAIHGLVRGLPKLKFEKDHLCSACALGKSTKQTTTQSEDTIKKTLSVAHDCVDIACREYKGTEFVNQTLREYYEKVDISHETSVARSPQ
ncbi:retrovirus-related pol polyprotein from transposon TNT 1-94 [Tanacetum coccineum]